MVIVTSLNFIFIGLIVILVKLIYQEIVVKISQKASGILLSSKSNFNEIILILNLKQILLVWTSITMIKLGEFNPFSGKDLVLLSLSLVSIKILNISKATLIADLGSTFSILLLGAVIGVRSSGSVIEPLSDLLASLTLVIPLLLWLLMLFTTYLLFSFLQMKILLPVIASVMITVVILKKVELKHSISILLLILILAFFSSKFMLKHRGDQDKNYVFTHPHTDNPVNNSFYLNQENTFSQAETKHEGRLRPEKMHLKGDQETIQATLQMKLFELRRDFLIVSYKSNKYQCELNAIDISDQNVFVKAFFKIILPLPRSISQFITANGLFSSLKLQGFAKDCRALIGRQITASILKVETYDNQTCSQMNQDDNYHDRSILSNIVSSLFSNFKAAIDHLSL